MNINSYFKSVIDQSESQVVICDLSHTIIYMNPVAIKQQAKHGGSGLVGKSLLNCHNNDSVEKILKTIEWFKQSKENNVVHEFYNEKQNKDNYIVALRDENGELIGYYERQRYRDKDLTPFYDYGT